MKLPWAGTRCIMCLSEGSLTEEHVIPGAVGGHLVVPFLCGTCNSILGSQSEARLKQDPAIRRAVAALQGQIPGIAASILDGQEFVADGPHGPIAGYFRSGVFTILARRLPDGSVIQPIRKALGALRTILSKAGHGPEEIKQAIARVQAAPEGLSIDVDSGVTVTTWPLVNARHPPGVPPVDPACILKIAFEFLVMHMGTAVYRESTHVESLRATIRGELVEGTYRIEYLTADRQMPLHGLYFEGNHPHAIVQVRLFGTLAYRVHFLHLAVDGPRYRYTHLLDSQVENLSDP